MKSEETPNEGDQDAFIASLSERYPFSSEQLKLIVRLDNYVNDDVGTDLDVLSTLYPEEPARKWIQTHLVPSTLVSQLFYIAKGRSASSSMYECIANLTGRKSSPHFGLEIVYDAVDKNVGEFIDTIYKLALASHILKYFRTIDLTQIPDMPIRNDGMVKSLESFLEERVENNSPDNMAENYLFDWIDMHFPMIVNVPSTFFHHAFFTNPSKEEAESDTNDGCMFDQYALGKRVEFQFPSLEKLEIQSNFSRNSISNKEIGGKSKTDSVFLKTLTGQDKSLGHLAFGLAMLGPELCCGKFHKLFSSEDGCAFVNLQKAMSGYSGPIIMLIRPTKDSSFSDSPNLFGIYTSNPWVLEKGFYGSSENFLFRVEPQWNIYRTRKFAGSEMKDALRSNCTENYMYFNPTVGHINIGIGIGSNKDSKGGRPRGLILGGTENDPRFHLTESFEQCIASSGGPFDDTYMSGPLLVGEWDKYFNVDVIEIWAVGGDEIVKDAINLKLRHEGLTDSVRRRVQRVDKSQFLDDFQSGLVVGGKLFEHRFDGSVRHEYGVDIDSE